ncbi:hypothetical protein PHJA_000972200 [Phtheirospermum japonicum]|uniref:Uncharacterized protein n=1 Tax=Phtheirospermum japonicum TaxID=374723 RepID=A0A830BYB6_9LAMI|nr:hypothetical protein PHJA_000972200 [Phtheirospermum japonicum]
MMKSLLFYASDAINWKFGAKKFVLKLLDKVFSSTVKDAVNENHGLGMQFVGINFMESLVSEFSPSTSTAMGLPREFREQCQISLEQDSLHLMLQILNWDFRGKNAVDNAKRWINVFFDGMKQENNSLRSLSTDPAWRGVLVSSGNVGWLLNFYTALWQKFSCEGYWLD